MYKLGKKAPSKRDSIKFGDFLTNLPTAPLVDLAPNYVYPMDGNDVWGDCACADEAHSQQVVTGLLTGTQVIPTIQEIETWYKTQNPTWDSTSGEEGNGMDIQTFLEYLTTQNLVVGFAEIDYKNTPLFQAAIYIGLSIKVGVQLQQAQMGQQFTDGLWDYVPGSPTVGGHDICFVGYDETTKLYSLISWGKLIQCTQAFVDNCVDEAWFPVRPLHISHPGFRNSFDLLGFSQAVAELTGGKVSIPVPTTMPTVTIKRAWSDTVEIIGGLNVTVGGTKFSCYTLEPTNHIPAGTYQCVWSHMNDLNEDHYLLVGNGQEDVFIHEGNYYTDTKGCIILGKGLADLNNDGIPDVTTSKVTVGALEALMGHNPFTLIIS